MNIQVYNALRAPYHLRTEKPSDQPSLTIPDDSMTIPEILRRYTNGLPMSGLEPIWNEDEDGNPLDLPDIRKLDLEELRELQSNTRDQILSLQKKMQDESQKKAREKIIREVEADYERKTRKNRYPGDPGSPSDPGPGSPVMKTPPEADDPAGRNKGR